MNTIRKKLLMLHTRLRGSIVENRSGSAFSVVVFNIIAADLFFHSIYPFLVDWIQLNIGISIGVHESIDLGFAPEIWGGILALVLGTLIIVIAIAAESTPKLIDLYLKDWTSLLYIWFLILGTLHSAFIMFYAGALDRYSSVLLNIYVFLFAAMLLSFPYIFYILLYSKTSNVIWNLHRLNLENIYALRGKGLHLLMEKDSKIIKEYQRRLMASTDQFADLLDYISFKEAQTEIIHYIGKTLRIYITQKDEIPKGFFQITDSIRLDSSFRTYVENQYKDLQKRQTFYEVKIFRTIGNAYFRKINEDEYELASLIGSELAESTVLALELKREDLITDAIIRFNTMMRFGIKHAVRYNEARNLYNLSFHYSYVLQMFIKHKRENYLKQCCFYLKYYGNDIYRCAANSHSLYFIVDTLTAELRKIAILLSEEKWNKDIQEEILDIILQMDNPPDYNKDTLDQSVNNGVRILQIGLALHYLKVGEQEFAEKIVLDSLEDLAYIDEQTYLLMLERLYERIRRSGKTFWEDTDRGNTNIYFSPDAEYIDNYSILVQSQIKLQLQELNRGATKLKQDLLKLRSKTEPVSVEDQDKINNLLKRITNHRKTFFLEDMKIIREN